VLFPALGSPIIATLRSLIMMKSSSSTRTLIYLVQNNFYTRAHTFYYKTSTASAAEYWTPVHYHRVLLYIVFMSPNQIQRLTNGEFLKCRHFETYRLSVDPSRGWWGAAWCCLVSKVLGGSSEAFKVKATKGSKQVHSSRSGISTQSMGFFLFYRREGSLCFLRKERETDRQFLLLRLRHSLTLITQFSFIFFVLRVILLF
jgi:hypothetical protein